MPGYHHPSVLVRNALSFDDPLPKVGIDMLRWLGQGAVALSHNVDKRSGSSECRDCWPHREEVSESSKVTQRPFVSGCSGEQGLLVDVTNYGVEDSLITILEATRQKTIVY